MKKIIIVILSIIILLAGAYFILKYADSIVQTNSPAPAGNEEVQIKAESRNISKKNTALNYELTADYPEFSGIVNTDSQNRINQDIKNFIGGKIKGFEEYSKENCSFSDMPNPPSWACELDVAFGEFNLVNNKVLSIRTESYQFLGGAHGSANFEFLNYDINTGEIINWRNVFKNGSQYMQKIADYSKDDLKTQLLKSGESMTDESWILRGTEPTDENYNTNVGFNKDGLVIIFQQYQVAPYASGSQQVVIPFNELQGYLK